MSDETNRLDAAAKKFESYCEPEGSASSGQQVSQKLDETVRLAHETREAIKSMQSNLDSLNTLLDELETRFEDTGFWARFEVFVWYLLLPLGVAILSVWPIVARTFG